ncbi:MAG: hypothetical protein ACRDNZ_14540 [Streptosporangiaceae bacterium]
MAGTQTPQAAQPPHIALTDDDDQVNQHGETAKSRLDRVLGRLPGILSSKPVIIFGILLFCYLFLYAGIATLLGHPGAVSANTQLILGNYTNVSSSVGAGIAAGAGLTLLKRQRKVHRISMAAHNAAMDAKALAEQTHHLLRLAFPEHAATLGHAPAPDHAPAPEHAQALDHAPAPEQAATLDHAPAPGCD